MRTARELATAGERIAPRDVPWIQQRGTLSVK